MKFIKPIRRASIPAVGVSIRSVSEVDRTWSFANRLRHDRMFMVTTIPHRTSDLARAAFIALT
jgi:hypothetical protein